MIYCFQGKLFNKTRNPKYDIIRWISQKERDEFRLTIEINRTPRDQRVPTMYQFVISTAETILYLSVVAYF